ncbi:hypothetical protein [Paralysiella testudinis]|uniref:Uncharacterized protein n=1 Tax=Paralysiella testudinis TaxID=2809020 RepID=A0A892ZIV5_9NEIS|nr:hypothetical protein [Paralysiella testudinis]QRQ82862.1 hypothetical protein JQU52_05640 [Paralysiella testudinis]
MQNNILNFIRRKHNPATHIDNDLLMQRLHRQCGIELLYKDGDDAVVSTGGETYRVPYEAFLQVVAGYLPAGPGIGRRFTERWQDEIRFIIDNVFSLIANAVRVFPLVLCACLLLVAMQGNGYWQELLNSLQNADVFINFMWFILSISLLVSSFNMAGRLIFGWTPHTGYAVLGSVRGGITRRQSILNWLAAESAPQNQPAP